MPSYAPPHHKGTPSKLECLLYQPIANVTDRLQCVRLVTSGSIGPGVLPNKEGCLAVQGDESKWE
jgi:hypothetical protein